MSCKELIEIQQINDGPKPLNLKASTELKDKIVLNWDNYVDADKYTVYRNGSVHETNITGNSFTDYKIENGTDYTYQVQAFKGSCGSELSDPAVGKGDANGYTFYAEAEPVSMDGTQTIRLYVRGTGIEIDYGSGYQPVFTGVHEFEPTDIIKIRSDNLISVLQLRFYPADVNQGHPNEWY
jgi:hypothetical protein